MVRFGRIWPTRPAACQVVPQVSFPCSRTRTSVSPSAARWYAVEQPAMPPPTITMRAWLGRVMAVIVVASESSYRKSSGGAMGEP